MSSQIIQSIRSFVSINQEEEEAFSKILRLRTFKKKDFLLEAGQVCNKVTFVNSGCIRLFYNIDGTENTVQFFFEAGWHTDYDSFLTGQPTVENIQALQTSEVVQINKDDLYALYGVFPIFERVGRIMAENAFLSLSRRNQMLTNEQPEARYLNLLKMRPAVVQQIPQHYIASYLGIKPESLSRIRKRILLSS